MPRSSDTTASGTGEYRIKPRHNRGRRRLYQNHFFEIDYIRFYKNKFVIDDGVTDAGSDSRVVDGAKALDAAGGEGRKKAAKLSTEGRRARRFDPEALPEVGNNHHLLKTRKIIDAPISDTDTASLPSSSSSSTSSVSQTVADLISSALDGGTAPAEEGEQTGSLFENGWREEFSPSSCVDGKPNPNVWEYEIGIPRPGNWEAQLYTDQKRNAFCTRNGTLMMRAYCEQGSAMECAMLTCDNQKMPLKCNTRTMAAPAASTGDRESGAAPGTGDAETEEPQATTPWISSSSLQMKHQVVESGTLIARIRGNDTARGAWSAFWMMGEEWRRLMNGKEQDFAKAGKSWPTCGEIDIRELNSKYQIIDQFSFYNDTFWSPEYAKIGGVYLKVKDMPKDDDGWTIFVVEYRNNRNGRRSSPAHLKMKKADRVDADDDDDKVVKKKRKSDEDDDAVLDPNRRNPARSQEDEPTMFTDAWRAAEHTLGIETDPTAPDFVPSIVRNSSDPEFVKDVGLRTWWMKDLSELDTLTTENALLQMPRNGKMSNRLIKRYWETFENNNLFVKLNLAIGGISEGPYFVPPVGTSGENAEETRFLGGGGRMSDNVNGGLVGDEKANQDLGLLDEELEDKDRDEEVDQDVGGQHGERTTDVSDDPKIRNNALSDLIAKIEHNEPAHDLDHHRITSDAENWNASDFLKAISLSKIAKGYEAYIAGWFFIVFLMLIFPTTSRRIRTVLAGRVVLQPRQLLGGYGVWRGNGNANAAIARNAGREEAQRHDNPSSSVCINRVPGSTSSAGANPLTQPLVEDA
ncbi:unnamed protein product [Amoebophrya sp. A120]|nr:unnamed protein product [Amoebophrya sp. A120]|eukprot:GSA120T00010550001.1